MMDDTQREAFWQAYKAKLDLIIQAFNTTYGTSVAVSAESAVNNNAQYNWELTFQDAFTIATFREQIKQASKYFTDRGVSYYVYSNGDLILKFIFMLDSEAADMFKYNLESLLEPYLKSLSSTLMFTADEYTSELSIYTNQEVSITMPSFITQVEFVRDSVRPTIRLLKFTVQENNTGEPRVGSIDIANTAGTMTWSVPVAQEG